MASGVFLVPPGWSPWERGESTCPDLHSSPSSPVCFLSDCSFSRGSQSSQCFLSPPGLPCCVGFQAGPARPLCIWGFCLSWEPRDGVCCAWESRAHHARGPQHLQLLPCVCAGVHTHAPKCTGWSHQLEILAAGLFWVAPWNEGHLLAQQILCEHLLFAQC